MSDLESTGGQEPQTGDFGNSEEVVVAKAEAGTESEQSVVEVQLSLDELNQKYPVAELVGPQSMDAIKSGLDNMRWISIFKGSPFKNNECEAFLGGYITESMQNGSWKTHLPAERNDFIDKIIEDGMFAMSSKNELIPTEKCLKFVKERLAPFSL